MSGHYSILNNAPTGIIIHVRVRVLVLILILSLILGVFIPTEAKAAAAAKQLNTDKSQEMSLASLSWGWLEWMPNSWPAEINVSTASNALSLRLQENARLLACFREE